MEDDLVEEGFCQGRGGIKRTVYLNNYECRMIVEDVMRWHGTILHGTA